MRIAQPWEHRRLSRDCGDLAVENLERGCVRTASRSNSDIAKVGLRPSRAPSDWTLAFSF